MTSRRNRGRFPEDFMFHLGKDEAESLVSQNAIPSKKHLGGYFPYVFTQEGVAMLSSVLRSERAIQVNIAIMRVFVKLRRMLADNKELSGKLEALERKYDARFKAVFDAIRRLMAPPDSPRRRIGFHAEIQ